jgi:hypothetical protein
VIAFATCLTAENDGVDSVMFLMFDTTPAIFVTLARVFLRLETAAIAVFTCDREFLAFFRVDILKSLSFLI